MDKLDKFDKILLNIVMLCTLLLGVLMWGELDIKKLLMGLFFLSVTYVIHNRLYSDRNEYKTVNKK